MKNTILILLFFVLCSVVMAQQNKPARHIVTKDYEGYIWAFPSIPLKDSLTLKEIEQVENIIRKSLREITRLQPELNYEYIVQNYNNYVRQYIKHSEPGLDTKVVVKFVIKNQASPKMFNTPFGIDDGGTTMWVTRINLTKGCID